jgi:hypothetical protein
VRCLREDENRTDRTVATKSAWITGVQTHRPPVSCTTPSGSATPAANQGTSQITASYRIIQGKR